MKSHVTMEQHRCPVCGAVHDTGSLLLDRELRDKFEDKTVTGMSLCAEHQAMVDNGFTILIEMSGAMSRTGRIVQIRNTVWPDIFDVVVPPGGVAFVNVDTIEKLVAMQAQGPSDAVH